MLGPGYPGRIKIWCYLRAAYAGLIMLARAERHIIADVRANGWTTSREVGGDDIQVSLWSIRLNTGDVLMYDR